MKKTKSFRLSDERSDQGFLNGYLPPVEPTQVPEQYTVLTRQTFVIRESILDKLRNFVHTKKKYHDYNYNQRMALEEALELLFATIEEIEPRDA